MHGEQLLILFRVIQGIGGGALFPVAFAIIFRVFPPEQRGPASAVIGVPVLLAPAFGPTIGGYLTTTFDWTAIFFVNMPIGIVALIACAFILKGRDVERAEYNVDVPTGRRFDILGLLLSMAGFTALVYGISESGSKGLGDQRVLTFLGVGVVLLIGFVVNELLVSDPVMDVRLFLNRTFTMSNILMWGVSAFLFGSFVLLPIFFENVQGRTPLNTGEILILQGLAAAVATVIAGRLYNTVGPRTMAVLGFALIAVGTYGFTNLSVSSDPASLQPWLILRGFGLGFTNIPLQTLAVSVITQPRDGARLLAHQRHAPGLRRDWHRGADQLSHAADDGPCHRHRRDAQDTTADRRRPDLRAEQAGKSSGNRAVRRPTCADDGHQRRLLHRDDRVRGAGGSRDLRWNRPQYRCDEARQGARRGSSEGSIATVRRRVIPNVRTDVRRT